MRACARGMQCVCVGGLVSGRVRAGACGFPWVGADLLYPVQRSYGKSAGEWSV